MREPNGLDEFVRPTKDLCWAAGASRRRVQLLVEGGVLVPARKGHSAALGVAGAPDCFSVLQTVAVAYGEAFRAAGAHPSWADAAVRWVAARQPGELYP